MNSGSLKQKHVHFYKKKNKLHNDPSLKLDISEIPVVNEYKFLGIIFEKKTNIYSPFEIPKN